MKEIRIGLLGFGTVGSGLVKGLQENGELLATRLGIRLVLHRIADLDLESDRGVRVDPALLTRDAAAVVADPQVDAIVELIGGVGAARELVLKALALGKPVVTANKHLLAKHGAELFRLAAEKRTDLCFGASVGGGIPLIRALREGLMANRFRRIYGIVNGTCNYILTRMEKEGLPFERVLADAQAEGYAEADPAFDIDGIDSAHKAVILATLAYGAPVPYDAASIEGIRGLAREDVAHAAALGYRVKLLAMIRRDSGGLEVAVHPTLVPHGHLLAGVDGVFNGVVVEGDMTGTTLYYGRGAGSVPTAATIMADLADIARNLVLGCPQRVPAVCPTGESLTVKPAGESSDRFYLRFAPTGRSDALAGALGVLGRHGVGVMSAGQEDARADAVVLTQEAPVGRVDAALAELQASGVAGPEPVRLRILG